MLKKFDDYLISILILLQRTELQRKFKPGLFSQMNRYSGGSLSLIQVLVQAANSQSVMKDYAQGEIGQRQEKDIHDEINQSGVTSNDSFCIADIGSGIGGYHKEWLKEFPKGTVFLIDQTRFNISALLYGYGKTNRYYNNLRMAKKYLLSSSTISSNQIQLVDSRYLGGVFQKCSIVVSYLSLGFHYPLEVYWDEIWTDSAVKVLLLDIRANSESQLFLMKKLGSGYEARVVFEDIRSTRYRVTRKLD